MRVLPDIDRNAGHPAPSGAGDRFPRHATSWPPRTTGSGRPRPGEGDRRSRCGPASTEHVRAVHGPRTGCRFSPQACRYRPSSARSGSAGSRGPDTILAILFIRDGGHRRARASSRLPGGRPPHAGVHGRARLALLGGRPGPAGRRRRPTEPAYTDPEIAAAIDVAVEAHETGERSAESEIGLAPRSRLVARCSGLEVQRTSRATPADQTRVAGRVGGRRARNGKITVGVYRCFQIKKR